MSERSRLLLVSSRETVRARFATLLRDTFEADDVIAIPAAEADGDALARHAPRAVIIAPDVARDTAIGMLRAMEARDPLLPAVVVGGSGAARRRYAESLRHVDAFLTDTHDLAEWLPAAVVRSLERATVERARGEAESARRRGEEAIRTLFRIVSAPGIPLEAQAREIIALGCERFRMDVGSFSVCEDAERMRVVYLHGPEDYPLRTGAEFALSTSLSGRVVERSAPIAEACIESGALASTNSYRRVGVRSYLGCPVHSSSRLLGTLSFSSRTPRPSPFTSADVELIRLMARWLGREHERIEHERRALRSEERFRGLIEGSIQGVLIHRRWRPLFANRAMAEMLGYASVEELLACPSLEPHVAEHERARRRAYMEARLRGEPAPARYVTELVRRDGAAIRVENLVTVIDWDGEPAIQNTVIDVTERDRAEAEVHRSEERFRDFADSAADWLWETDPDGRYTYLSSNYERITGFAIDSVLGTTREALWERFAVSLPEAVARIRARLRAGRSFKDFRFEGRTEGGARMVVSLSGKPVLDGGGTLVSWRGTGRDVTAEADAEATLRRSEDQLRRLALRLQSVREDERRTIAREVHDELGQVLTGLKMDLAWLRDLLPEDDGDESARARADALLRMIDEAVASTRRIVSSLRPPLLDDLGLDAAVEWMAREFAGRAGLACGIDVEEGASTGTPEGDTAAFRIFQESLTNVARYAGAGRIAVSLVQTGRSLVLDVRDDGVGISEDALFGAASLGLLGMRERAASAGGDLHIGRGPAGGTWVRLRLPVRGPSARAETG